MKKFKKLATLLLSFCLIASVGFSIVACEKDPVASSSPEVSDSTSEPETSEDDSSGDETPPEGNEIVQPPLHSTVSEDEINDPEHVWTTWEAIQEPTCVLNGIKQRVCQNNPEHIHQDYIAARALFFIIRIKCFYFRADALNYFFAGSDRLFLVIQFRSSR